MARTVLSAKPNRRAICFFHYAFATNTALMVVGFVLVGYQLTGYLVA